jgi:bacteriocin biosynthesis cyclodehydratase domain-containing protein
VTAVVPERPLLKPWYRLAVDDGKVVLDHAQSAVVFEGAAAARLLPALLPLLDGEHSLSDIVATLGRPAAAAIEQALELLAAHRLLTDPLPDPSAFPDRDETVRFLLAADRSGRDASTVREALEQAQVTIAGTAPLGEEVARILLCSGVEQIDRVSLGAQPLSDCSLALVAPVAYELSELSTWNRRCLASGIVWLALLPCDGRFAPVGPLFVPGETACYDCFRIRRASTCGYAAEFWSLEDAPVSYPDPVPIRRTVAGLAGWLVLRWLVGRDASLPGVLHALELGPPLTVSAHHVWRVPRCPSCSNASATAPPSPWFDGDLR